MQLIHVFVASFLTLTSVAAMAPSTVIASDAFRSSIAQPAQSDDVTPGF